MRVGPIVLCILFRDSRRWVVQTCHAGMLQGALADKPRGECF